MKKLSVLLLTLVLMANCAHTPRGGSVRQEIRNIYESSVSIAAKDGDVSGSGTIIRNNKDEQIVVVTAAHVVRGIEKRWKDMVEKKKATGEVEFFVKLAYVEKLKKVNVLKIDDKKDLALLIGVDKETKNGPFVVVSSNVPNIGDPIWVIGAPMGDERTVTNGIVSNFDNSTPGRRLYRVSAPIFFGNSGGGLFNSNMELIGVINSIQSLGGFIFIPGAGFAVSLEDVREFL